MFEVGDIVRIIKPDDGMAMPGSPVDNLEGTIAKIRAVKKEYFGARYHLEFLKLKIKEQNRFEDTQADCAWRDKHLELYNEKLEENDIDIMEIFEA